MGNRIKIGDFVSLTGTTLKTVMYYHKIGLLPEPERSSGGYRLYGSDELARMRLIKQLKFLGMDLKGIKEILGDIQDNRTFREVLESLHQELLNDKNEIEERLFKVEKMLEEGITSVNDDNSLSSSFQMISDTLGQDKVGEYMEICPQLFDQQRRVFGILDNFQWGDDFQETLLALAEYFKTHPEEYQISLSFGKRLARLAQLPEDDPEVETLARESAEFIKKIPQLKEMLHKEQGIKNPYGKLYDEVVSNIISPAQAKLGRLMQLYISQDDQMSK